jgi:hypothetical protein
MIVTYLTQRNLMRNVAWRRFREKTAYGEMVI